MYARDVLLAGGAGGAVVVVVDVRLPSTGQFDHDVP
jgi:hypothetical protein